ncbi:MAG: Lrp/AsnC family transcriptional regulator [Candidatus Bathyarchaeota archaeon]|nr:MAG: Lrp/AsnC family transcriptional regulator [Candidatus Bathyarchaeota archaeon]
MTKLKDLDLKILFELIKNSKTSDRQLAKKIGVSQPTITRRRARLEREVIDGYTAIPKWDKLGYNLLAVTLVKTPFKFASNEKRNNAYNKSMKWLAKQSNVIMGSGCRGMGMTGILISLHKNYADLDEFLTNHREQLGDILEDVQTVVVNLSGKAVYRPLHLKYLAERK